MCLPEDHPGEEEPLNFSDFERPYNFLYGRHLKINFEIPFEGSAELFLVQPNHHTSLPPVARLSENSLLVSVSAQDLSQQELISNNLNQEVFKINQYLDWLREEVDTYNLQLRNLAFSIQAKKQETARQQQQLAQNLGIKIKSRLDAGSPVDRNSTPKSLTTKEKVSQLPTKKSMRRLIEEMLLTDSDFDAFCVDFFPVVAKRIGNNMDRVMKTNLLLQLSDPSRVIEKLREWSPTEYDRFAYMIEHE